MFATDVNLSPNHQHTSRIVCYVDYIHEQLFYANFGLNQLLVYWIFILGSGSVLNDAR